MHESMMTTELTEFKNTFKKWVDNEVVPHHEEWEQKGITPREVYTSAGEQGFLCLTAPEEYEGMGLDFRYSAIVIEELAYALTSGVAFFLHSDVIVPYLSNYGNDTQKRKWLPGLINGSLISAIAMTEPGTGSDLQAISTKAELKDDHWVLNGAKTFISNGHVSNWVIVVARTEVEGSEKSKYAPLSLFVVEEGAEGFERGRNLSKMGLKAQDTAELSFTNCKIPKENLLGEVGKGFLYLTNELATERLTVAVWSLATAKRCLDLTVEYTKGRKAFGKSISDFQNTKFKLAEMATEISVAEAFVDRCIQGLVDGKEMTVEASKAKYWCSEMLCRVADEGVQLFGGYGYMSEYPISKAYVDARVQRIYAGTTEIMKEIISRDLIK
ncbi:MAG: acyl-CoA dehydrogenase family protein [Bacteriovoracaceae bacterium]|nr:acyl-CoA dehydrogenase family protein [Bacteriovoracaceae bacterium]